MLKKIILRSSGKREFILRKYFEVNSKMCNWVAIALGHLCYPIYCTYNIFTQTRISVYTWWRCFTAERQCECPELVTKTRDIFCWRQLTTVVHAEYPERDDRNPEEKWNTGKHCLWWINALLSLGTNQGYKGTALSVNPDHNPVKLGCMCSSRREYLCNMTLETSTEFQWAWGGLNLTFPGSQAVLMNRLFFILWYLGLVSRNFLVDIPHQATGLANQIPPVSWP